MEKEIYDDINAQLSKLDIAAIVEKRVKERMEEIHWQDAIAEALKPAIDEHVDEAENFWINSIRKYKEKLDAHYKELKAAEYKGGGKFYQPNFQNTNPKTTSLLNKKPSTPSTSKKSKSTLTSQSNRWSFLQ